MDVEEAIKSRRTHKAFEPTPVEHELLRDLFELARWSPNHHLTNPWRFRVIGVRALAQLKAAADALKPGSAAKLDRAPTLVVVSAKQTGDPVQDREDLLATGVAAYIVLLAAHSRGLAGYWRTVAALDEPAGRAAVGLDDDETPVGLLHLGRPRQDQRVPQRAEIGSVVTFLD